MIIECLSAVALAVALLAALGFWWAVGAYAG